jgi:hypothetical protein
MMSEDEVRWRAEIEAAKARDPLSDSNRATSATHPSHHPSDESTVEMHRRLEACTIRSCHGERGGHGGKYSAQLWLGADTRRHASASLKTTHSAPLLTAPEWTRRSASAARPLHRLLLGDSCLSSDRRRRQSSRCVDCCSDAAPPTLVAMQGRSPPLAGRYSSRLAAYRGSPDARILCCR